MKQKYLAYVLDDASRKLLLTFFPPSYEKVSADHVTYSSEAFGCETLKTEQMPVNIKPLMYLKNHICECVVVSVDGNHKRSDRKYYDKYYHITISTPTGLSGVVCNDLINEYYNLARGRNPFFVNKDVPDIYLRGSLRILERSA